MTLASNAGQTSLFRPEVADARNRRLWGEVVLQPPSAVRLTSALVLGGTSVIAAFLFMASFPRIESASGFLSTDKGLVKVHAVQAGTVDAVMVTEGMRVPAGAPLAMLLSERLTSNGMPVHRALLESIDEQIAQIDARADLERRRHEAARNQLLEERKGIEEEIHLLSRRRDVQLQLFGLSRENADIADDLVRKGLAAETDRKARRMQALEQEQRIAALAQEEIALTHRLRQLDLEIANLTLGLQDRLAQLAQEQTGLRRQRMEQDGRRVQIVTAPVAGTVAGLQATAGMRITDDIPLLTLVPENSRLEAHLHVPSKSVGFLKPGMPVRIRYDAYDHRHHGTGDGRIYQVSATILPAAETQAPKRSDEPAYLVKVALTSTAIRTREGDIPLRPGMQLNAEIILERRSLLEWIFSSLFRLGGAS